MKKVRNYFAAGSRDVNEPRQWNRNTELCVDLKTLLRSDRIARMDESYPGVLTRDDVDHFLFIETLPQTACRRNPRLYDGRYISLTRWNDGSLRLYFKKMKVDEDFSVERFAIAVYNEICMALEGLVGR